MAVKKRNAAKNQKKINKPAVILIFLFALLIVNMILGVKLYSIELASVLFVISAIVLFFLRIDSRFPILLSILMLGYSPFLLAAKKELLAETFAIYSLYFLVIGIVLQFLEIVNKKESSLSLSNMLKILDNKFLKKAIVEVGFLTVIFFIMGIFTDIVELLKWTFLYILITLFATYIIIFLKQDN